MQFFFKKKKQNSMECTQASQTLLPYYRSSHYEHLISVWEINRLFLMSQYWYVVIDQRLDLTLRFILCVVYSVFLANTLWHMSTNKIVYRIWLWQLSGVQCSSYFFKFNLDASLWIHENKHKKHICMINWFELTEFKLDIWFLI